jgi:hypothetical protein
MVSGIMMAIKGTDKHFGNNTATAAVPTYYSGFKLPLDLQLDLEKRQSKDTVYVHDSIPIKCNHKERVKVLKPKHVTDTLYVPMLMPEPMASMPVINKISGDREEYTPAKLWIGSKPHSVTLSVDGQIVYKTENDIHSTEDRQ